MLEAEGEPKSRPSAINESISVSCHEDSFKDDIVSAKGSTNMPE